MIYCIIFPYNKTKKEFEMLNKLQFSLNRLDRMGVIALVCGFALIASACGGAVVNSPDSTSNTSKEAVSPTGISTEVPAETPAASPLASGAEQDVCLLITNTDAEAVMGQPVASINPFSYLDSDYGETVFSCYYMGKDLTIIVSRVDLGSAQAASNALQQQLVKEQADTAGAIINEEPGLGEKAYWTKVEEAGIFSFLKGSKIFVIGLTGNVGDADSYKSPLLALAKTVASKY